MKKSNIYLVAQILILVSFSLVSCSNPDKKAIDELKTEIQKTDKSLSEMQMKIYHLKEKNSELRDSAKSQPRKPIDVSLTTSELVTPEGFIDIEGKTNLPNGTNLFGLIGKKGSEYSFAEFDVTVANGSFQTKNVAYTLETFENGRRIQKQIPFEPGVYELSISLSHQEDFIEDIFGKEKEYLTGSLIKMTKYDTKELEYEKDINVSGTTLVSTGERARTKAFLDRYETLFNELQVMKNSSEFKQYGFARAKYKQWQEKVFQLRDDERNIRTPGVTILPMHMHQLAMEYMRGDNSEFAQWAETGLRYLFTHKNDVLDEVHI